MPSTCWKRCAAPASASTSWCSIRRPSSSAARTCRTARRRTASSTSWPCGCSTREALLVSCSCSYHLGERGAARRDPGGGASRGALRADAGRGGQSPRPSGASGHPGNPVSEGILLPRHARARVRIRPPHADTIPTSTRSRCSSGPLQVHWYGIMYLVGFAAAWWLARRRAAQPGSTWKRAATSTTSSSTPCSA